MSRNQGSDGSKGEGTSYPRWIENPMTVLEYRQMIDQGVVDLPDLSTYEGANSE